MTVVLLAQRATVRARINGSEDQTPEEILKNIRMMIQEAYAIKLLRSEDVKVLVKNQINKNRALN